MVACLPKRLKIAAPAKNDHHATQHRQQPAIIGRICGCERDIYHMGSRYLRPSFLAKPCRGSLARTPRFHQPGRWRSDFFCLRASSRYRSPSDWTDDLAAGGGMETLGWMTAGDGSQTGFFAPLLTPQLACGCDRTSPTPQWLDPAIAWSSVIREWRAYAGAVRLHLPLPFPDNPVPRCAEMNLT